MNKRKLTSLMLGVLVFTLSSCGPNPVIESSNSEPQSSVSSSTPFISSNESISESSSFETSSSSSASSISSSSASSSYISSTGSTDLTYWSGITDNLIGVELRDRLQLICNQKGTKTVSYKGLDKILPESDGVKGKQGYIYSFYTGKEIKSGYNKEHVWPNSRGVGESKAGSDPQMIRPADSGDNSERGNMVFGTVANSYDPASLGFPEYRGIAARIIFYTCMRYWNNPTRNGTHLHLTDNVQPNGTGAASTGNQMGRISELLKWNNDYPIHATEIQRNEVLGEMGFARNPFIDHPEWVDRVWDLNVVTASIDTCYYRTVL